MHDFAAAKFALLIFKVVLTRLYVTIDYDLRRFEALPATVRLHPACSKD
jgi:hypothetical protein